MKTKKINNNQKNRKKNRKLKTQQKSSLAPILPPPKKKNSQNLLAIEPASLLSILLFVWLRIARTPSLIDFHLNPRLSENSRRKQ